MDTTARLLLATRIHFALLRQFGETVAVRELLDGHGEGREALWVCAASGDAELSAMARELALANRRAAAAAAPPKPRVPERRAAAAETPRARAGSGRVPQDTAWSQHTTGFGTTRPAELADRAAAHAAASHEPSSWFAPMDWLRRSAAR